MATNNCDSSETVKKQCNAKGVAVCDAAYENLPTSPLIKVIGANGECLYTFEAGDSGLLFFDGETGFSRVENDINLDIPALVNLIGGGPDEDIPPTFDYLMVFDGIAWRKWRGPTANSGFVFWNQATGVFEFGQMNESGVCTTAIIPGATAGYIPVYPEAVDPTVAGVDKCQSRLTSLVPDLFYVDADGIARPVNPGNIEGMVTYDRDDLCEEDIRPRVRSFCEISRPPCADPPVPVSVMGCSDEGKPASTDETEALPTGACSYGLANPGAGGAWDNYPMGGTWIGGNHGEVRSATASTGSINNTITAAQINAAIGFTPPGKVTHVTFWVKAKITAAVDERRTLLISLGGVDAASISAYSWDAGTTEDQSESISEITVPVGASGEAVFDLSHSSSVSSNYTFSVQVAGLFVCPDFPA